jgi:hypothetical protein
LFRCRSLGLIQDKSWNCPLSARSITFRT